MSPSQSLETRPSAVQGGWGGDALLERIRHLGRTVAMSLMLVVLGTSRPVSMPIKTAARHMQISS